MTEPTSARTQPDRAPLVWGPLTRFALAVALMAAAIDQAAKLWLSMRSTWAHAAS